MVCRDLREWELSNLDRPTGFIKDPVLVERGPHCVTTFYRVTLIAGCTEQDGCVMEGRKKLLQVSTLSPIWALSQGSSSERDETINRVLITKRALYCSLTGNPLRVLFIEYKCSIHISVSLFKSNKEYSDPSPLPHSISTVHPLWAQILRKIAICNT